MTLIELYQNENQRLRDNKNKRLEDAVNETTTYLKEHVTAFAEGTNDFIIIRSSRVDKLTDLVLESTGLPFKKFTGDIMEYKKESAYSYFLIDPKKKNEIYKVFALSEEFIQIMNTLLSEGLTCAISEDAEKTYLLVRVKY